MKSQATQVVEEYKDSDAFKANTVAAIVGAYNLGFDDYKKVTNAFLSLDLRRITPTGELEEDKEEDEEDKALNPLEFHQLWHLRRLLWPSPQRSLEPLWESNLWSGLALFFSLYFLFLFQDPSIWILSYQAVGFSF